MNLTHVNFFLKNQRRSVALTNHIHVVGDNGTGKTALINAITLALTNRAYDLGYRDEASRPDMLSPLTVEGQGSVALEVEHEGTKGVATWEIAAGALTKAPVLPYDRVVMTYQEIWGAIRGSRNKSILFLVEAYGTDELMTKIKVASEDATAKAIVKQHLDAAQGGAKAKFFAAFASIGEAIKDIAGQLKEAAILTKHGMVPDLDAMESHKTEQAALESASDLIMEKFTAIAKQLAVDVSREASAYGTKVGIELTPKACRIGLQAPDGTVLEAASGAQWAGLVGALAGVWADRLDAQGYVPLCILPDRSFTSKTLRAMCNAFAQVKGIVIIQSCSAPVGRAMTDWTVINMERAETREPPTE